MRLGIKFETDQQSDERAVRGLSLLPSNGF